MIYFNAVFVCAEFAFVRARKTRMEELDDEGVAGAKTVLFGLNHLDAYLSVCQLGITLTSLGLGWLGEPAVSALLRPLFDTCGLGEVAVKSVSVIVGFIIITFLHVVFGELAPKSIAIQKSEKMVLSLAPFMKFCYYIFYPFVIGLNSAANVAIKILRVKPAGKKEQTLSAEEIKLIVEDSHEGGHIEGQEEEIIQNVLDFDEKIIRDIMTHRLDVKSVEANEKLSDIVPLVSEAKFTRYPVLDEEDKVIGVLHIKDAFCSDKDLTCEDIAQDPMFVPEIMPIETLLDRLKENHKQMAIVVDEYGFYQGIVTMEDVLEELVGEIQDEFNDEDALIAEKDGVITVLGKMNIDEMCEALDLKYDYDDQDISTVAGFVIDVMNKIPEKGETFKYGGYDWTVSEVEDQRIIKVTAKREKSEEE
ncbi:MAG: HlyC/CorC family transporter [Abditibacteriota bacterium]|nr:HlyC/CorC family transporter [Abditibacteriota bacterium]